MENADAADGDTLTNFQEQQVHSDPRNADTDDDGVNDDVEAAQFTSPAHSMSQVPRSAANRSGYVARALDLSSISSTGTTLPHAERFDSLADSWTVEYWIQLKEDTTGVVLGAQVSGDVVLEIGMNAGQPYAEYLTSTNQTVRAGDDYFTAFGTGEWHHVAVSYDSDLQALALYVDGLLWKSQSNAQPIEVPVDEDPTVYLGGNGNASSNFSSGLLDEVRVWNIARTAGQVEAMRDHMVLEGDDDLQAYYRFDDGGSSIEDFRVPLRADGIGKSYTISGTVVEVDAAALTFGGHRMPVAQRTIFDDANLDLVPDWYGAVQLPTAPSSATRPDGEGHADDNDDNSAQTDDGADGRALLPSYSWGGHLSLVDANGDGILDLDVDADSDGLANGDELILGLLPLVADTDDDGVSDGDEVLGGSDPRDQFSPVKELALAVNGSSYATLPLSSRFALPTWTIEAWVYPTAASAGSIVQRTVGGNNFKVGVEADGRIFVTFDARDGSGGVTLWSQATEQVDEPSPAATAQVDEWTHVAASFSAASNVLTLTLNGVESTTANSLKKPVLNGAGPVYTRIGEGLAASLMKFVFGRQCVVRLRFKLRWSRLSLARKQAWLPTTGSMMVERPMRPKLRQLQTLLPSSIG